jgi:hypothetical protein
MRNYYEVAGIAIAGALVAVAIQVLSRMWFFGLLPGQSGAPSVNPFHETYLFWGVTPLVFLASMVVARPSIKGLMLGAAIFLPVNIVGTMVLATIVLGLNGVGL